MQLDICPKCSHRLLEDAASCPACGVIFAKLLEMEARKQRLEKQSETGVIRDLISRVKDGTFNPIICVKAAFLMLLTGYGLKLIFTPILAFPDSGWWLHAVNLIFHEAGHVLFMPFGRFIQVLGGTLGQLLIPAVVVAAFFRKHDNFGAAVGIWWLGESFLDVAPYINDARAGQLMLLGGVTGSEVDDYHDWEVLLTRLGMMQFDHALARISFTIGSLLILAALFWGGYTLWKEFTARNKE